MDNLANELLKRKIQVLTFVFNMLIALGVCGLLVYIVNILTIKDYLKISYIPVFISITLLVFFTLIFIRIKINQNTYKVALYILVGLSSVSAISIVFINGITFSSTSYMIIITIILIIAIVHGIKGASIYSAIVFLFIGAITLLQGHGILQHTRPPGNSDVIDIVVPFFFMLIIINIARIGYGEIENSYSKALKYSHELEKFNLELEQRVKERSLQLKENFDKQVESMYNSAIVGSITRPLLHDIATPISSLKGVIDLIIRKKSYDKQLLDIANESAIQISTIINESRELMRGQDLVQTFNISEHIAKVIKILHNEIQKHEIKISIPPKSDWQIKGSISLFERLIVNLIVNAMEELANKEGNREISIVLNIDPVDKKALIEIKDNGRGIDSKQAEKIFDDDYSLKSSSGHNLGLGLPFVKRTIETKFNGSVKVESKLYQYTKFILAFNPYDSENQAAEANN